MNEAAFDIAQMIKGYGPWGINLQAQYGEISDIASTRRALNDICTHSDGPLWQQYQPAYLQGDYSWALNQVKAAILSQPFTPPQLLCGNFQALMGIVFQYLDGNFLGQARAIGSTGDIQACGFPLFEDHVFNYTTDDYTDHVHDADKCQHGVEYLTASGLSASIFDLCAAADDLDAKIIPTNSYVSGWDKPELADAAAIRHFWFAVHDQAAGLVMINWRAFDFVANPQALCVLPSDLNTPIPYRQAILATAGAIHKLIEIQR